MTFHRAIDITNSFKEFEKIIELGFERILTSGFKDKAISGIENIKKMV